MLNRTGVSGSRSRSLKRVRTDSLAIGLIIGLLLGSGCGAKKVVIKHLPPAEVKTVQKQDTVLKAHMKNGELIILAKWEVGDNGEKVTGHGRRLDINRHIISSGVQIVWLDSVALLESNQLMPASGVGALTLMTGLSLGTTVYCITNPKACFGSCPTFYYEENGESILVAEGFSSSVAPALEASDLDALYRIQPKSNRLVLTMTNEALETHVIRSVELLAVPVSPGVRCLADQDRNFWTTKNMSPPIRCEATTGDIRPLIVSFDSKEYFSPTDSLDLGAREEIEFEFDPSKEGNKGVVLAFRQTLLTTYLFYQTLSYMGTKAGEYLSALERGNDEALGMAHGLGEELGGIEISAMAPDGEWVNVGEVYETGPIATDLLVVPLPMALEKATRFKIRMARGNWRLDYLALAELGEKTEAFAIKPVRILIDGQPNDSILETLNDPELQVVTMPGDRLELVFDLPEGHQNWELFLDSQGYYLEWMRDEWIADENPFMLAQMFLDPKSAARTLAPHYKEIESKMEDLFWNSKYVK